MTATNSTGSLALTLTLSQRERERTWKLFGKSVRVNSLKRGANLHVSPWERTGMRVPCPFDTY
jgi:hypothetical protein